VRLSPTKIVIVGRGGRRASADASGNGRPRV
jgi:hypothetical protein